MALIPSKVNWQRLSEKTNQNKYRSNIFLHLNLFWTLSHYAKRFWLPLPHQLRQIFKEYIKNQLEVSSNICPWSLHLTKEQLAVCTKLVNKNYKSTSLTQNIFHHVICWSIPHGMNYWLRRSNLLHSRNYSLIFPKKTWEVKAICKSFLVVNCASNLLA